MTWMINVVRNRALDMRRSATYRSDEVEWSADADRRLSADNPLARAETNQELARVMRCMSELTEPQRRCIILMYHRGYTAVETAARLALPVGTVKTWARRGLIAIRECLAR
jgi:RNA polymerase sigma-70 factor (ECF subfamily)